LCIFRELTEPQMACQGFWLEGYREHPQSCQDVRVVFRSGAEWGFALSGETFCPSTDILSIERVSYGS
jgi:hypothetical protein